MRAAVIDDVRAEPEVREVAPPFHELAGIVTEVGAALPHPT